MSKVGRVKVQYRTGQRSNYDLFCKAHPDIKLTFEQWSEILYTFSYEFRDYILETGDTARMMWGFGDFTISKKKPKRKVTLPSGKEVINLPINWKETKKAGKYVYHMNYHTDGKRCKWYWFIKTARLPHTVLWVFKPSRISSRKIKEYVTKSPIYIERYGEHSKK
jgi:hypothetical protein